VAWTWTDDDGRWKKRAFYDVLRGGWWVVICICCFFRVKGFLHPEASLSFRRCYDVVVVIGHIVPLHTARF
jgi:hypothetical protein